MSEFAFHPELFEERTVALETMAERGFHWFEHFSSVDLLHDLYGLEVCGIAEEDDAGAILVVLQERFPAWTHTDLYYHDHDRDRGWKAMIFKKQKWRKRFVTE